MTAARSAAAVLLLLAAALSAGPAAAQQQAVCPNQPGNPAAGNRVECTIGDSQTHDVTGNIDIQLNGFDITAAERGHHGVAGQHWAIGDIDIRVTGGKIKVGKDAVQGDRGEAWGIAGVHERNTPGRVSIDVSGVDIDTKGKWSFGVRGLSRGPDGVRIRVRDSTIDTTGERANAISGRVHNAGGLHIGVTGGSFGTAGQNAVGVKGESYGTGDIILDIRDAAIVTRGFLADGVLGWNFHNAGIINSDGLIDIALSGRASVTTHGDQAAGANGEQSDPGATKDVRISLSGGAAVRTGASRTGATPAGGYLAHGVYGKNYGTGDIAIGLSDSASIGTKGDAARGIYGLHYGTGDIAIGLSGAASIRTEGARARGIYGLQFNAASESDVRIFLSGRSSVRTGGAEAHGVYADNDGKGGIFIGLSDSASVRTEGGGALGIRGLRWTGASGDIAISVADRASVTTSGAGADGIRAGHVSGDGTMTVTVGAGASVRATGENASGVQFGRLNSGYDGTDKQKLDGVPDPIPDGTLERAANLDAAGVYRKQTATVNGTVRGGTGDAAGVYLAGGGKVHIGPKGTVGAASGVSVWARRELDTENAPALHVSLDPGGRRMAKVLDGGWILNDGGKTTIVMNGVKLHDGTDGATGLWAPNGARDVTIRKAGVTVTIPKNGDWTISKRSESTVEGRDFSAADFTEVYAPRAAVYEALPGFLLRLDGGAASGAAGALYGPGLAQADAGGRGAAEVASSASGSASGAASGAGGKARAPGSPLWLRIGGGFGKYAARQADAKARYRFRRWEAEAGMDFRLAEGVTGYASARLASGSTRVAAPGGGGKASATGYGLAAGAEWTGADGWFAAGRASVMRYSLDVESATRGALAGGAGAWVFGYRAEAGKRMAAGAADLAGRVWLDGARMSLDGFSDAVASQVEAASAGRLSAGAGLGTETVRALSGGGGLALRGAFGAAFRLDEGTKTDVSGEALRSKGPGARLLLGLGAEWRPRKDDAGTALGFDAEASGAGSRDAAYSLNITLRTAF